MKVITPLIFSVVVTALPGSADLLVDQDLGVLPMGDTEINGTTAEVILDPGPPPITIGGSNRVQLIPVNNIEINPATNWGNEIVYQFSLDRAALVTIISNSAFSGDADFFVLDGLRTYFDPDLGKDVAEDGLVVAFLDGEAPEFEDLGVLQEGTYYLAVEHFDGFDGGIVPGDADFSVTLSLLEALPSEAVIDLGHVALADQPISFDTFGSDFNTELAIYDFFGALLFENDDAGGPQSEITIPAGLAEGTYYAVLAGSDVTFEDPGPLVNTGGEVGNFEFSFSLGPNLPRGVETGFTRVGSEGTESQWFVFSTTAPPDELIDLGTLANSGEPFEINTIGSGFDTQIGIYDSWGFLFYFNDDVSGTLQSAISIPEGLLEGTWYVALAGYNHFFADGFFLLQDGDTAGGLYDLNHPQGRHQGGLNSNDHEWFVFEIAAAPIVPSIEIASLEYIPASKEFTLSWDTDLDGPFTIRMGSEADLIALQPAPDNLLPTVVVAGVTSPFTVAVPAALQGEDKVFLQVSE